MGLFSNLKIGDELLLVTNNEQKITETRVVDVTFDRIVCPILIGQSDVSKNFAFKRSNGVAVDFPIFVSKKYTAENKPTPDLLKGFSNYILIQYVGYKDKINIEKGYYARWEKRWFINRLGWKYGSAHRGITDKKVLFWCYIPEY